MTIETLHLFRPLHQKLIEVLKSLDQKDWGRATLAREWSVKDVTAHMLDISLRAISSDRDQWELPAAAITDYRDLVNYLNRINADWVIAMRRVSPQLLIEWMDLTHEAYVRSLEKLDPLQPAKYSVAWAGETTSLNWFHVAREYTEKWHHQQQIREAIGRQGILTKEFYHPVLSTFLQALPFNYRNVDAPEGTQVVLQIDTEAGGTWVMERHKTGWKFVHESSQPQATIHVSATVAWKLFTKGIRAEDAVGDVSWKGPEELTQPALRMISVIA